jgi:RNA polymerase sigma factor (sigma-70 family)
MTLIEDREHWVALVGAAQRGDATAWPALIDRFEDIAVACAVGLCGDLDEAPDIAQEAFVLAFRHIDVLEDPAAFPAWLMRLVRTATNRRARRRRLDVVSLDEEPGKEGRRVPADASTGPDEVVLAAAQATEIRAAVERLPEGERCVVALHYLAEMPYVEVAAFLGISVSAAKKRAWSARSRLKELLPMVTEALTAARPSGTEAFRDTILLFQCDPRLRRRWAGRPSVPQPVAGHRHRGLVAGRGLRVAARLLGAGDRPDQSRRHRRCPAGTPAGRGRRTRC